MTRILRLGSAGADVTAAQDLLRARGFDPGKSDGAFGPRTDAAVRRFQSSRGLHADGIVGPQTRAELADDAAPTRPERRRVEKIQTPLSEAGLLNALAHGHETFYGDKPTRPRLATAWSHVALENGRGQYLYNNNFGNITGFRWQGSVYVIRVQERDPETDKWEWRDMLFRAHGRTEAGAHDYWSVMEKSYAAVLPFFDSGKPFDAALALGRLTWFTESPDQYARRMSMLFRDCPS
ncbi:peptidoglycan-binding domain-containing protein [Sorangium sp. So ce233]|uniref:peptidoglycan-binding domain-containing protein n=1 Tax=Sorangium sp. So ce233 TaxID=3133290 RepID=UPI003F62046E